MEADALAQYKQFLKQVINERLSTPPDEFVHPCLAGNYSLKPEEIKGEVCDWVLNYLEQSHCPHQLAIFLAATVSGQISASEIEKLSQSVDDDPYPTVNASALHGEVLLHLDNLCRLFLTVPEKMANCNFERTLPFSSSIFAIKNKRRKMEDRHVVIHDLNSLLNLEKFPMLSYYAVYDGHAGIDAANFAAAHLHENIVQHPDFSTDTIKAIKESYKLTDAHICERAIREGIKGGCTVVSALFKDKTLYLSWVGDSQAILVKQGKPVKLMNPHKPDREDERKRIEDLGGSVYFMGIWRVNGQLAVARSLGDHDFKPHVCSDPDVTVVDLDGTEDFLVLACDGLWDGMSPQEVTSVLYRNIMEHTDNDSLEDTLAKKLVHQSKLQGSEDNISVIVVLLRNVAAIQADAMSFGESVLHVNGKSENYVIEVNESILEQQFGNNTSTIVVQNQVAERPKDLNELTSFPSLNAAFGDCPQHYSPNHGLATCLPPEATALSELPTPPIDDIAPTGQFSELTHAEQVEQLQFHLESTGFQGTSFGECALNASHDDDDGEIMVLQPSTQDPMLDPPDFYTTEVSSRTVFPTNELSVRDASPEKAAMDIASDIISSTIESAIERVNVASDASPVAPEMNGTPSRLNPNAEPFVMKNFSPQSPILDEVSPLSPNINEPLLDFGSNPFASSNPEDKIKSLYPEDPLHDLEVNNPSTNPFELVTGLPTDGNPLLSPAAQFTNENAEQNLIADLDVLEANPSVGTEPCLMEANTPEKMPQLLEPLSASNVSDFGLNIEHSAEQTDSNSSEKLTDESEIQKEVLQPFAEVSDSFQKCSLVDVSGLDELSKTEQNIMQVETNNKQIEVEEAVTEVPKSEENASLFSEQLKGDAGFENSDAGQPAFPVPADVIENLNIEVSKETLQQESKNELDCIGDILLADNILVECDIKDTLSADVEVKSGVEDTLITGDMMECTVTDTLSAVDADQQIVINENSISPSLSKQVIGVDSLLPKEVQDELLKVAESTQPETAPEDSQTAGVAVDLKSIPDGVPEADGVSEDVDSDSEKDGGWSYVKANENLDTKSAPVDSKGSATKTKRPGDKKTMLAPSLPKKEPLKTSKDTTAKTKISSLSDRTKKPPVEKKTNEVKLGTVTKTTATTVRQTPVNRTTKLPATSASKSLPQKAAGESTLATSKSTAPRSDIKAQTTRVITKTTVQGPMKPILQKTTTINASAKPTRPTTATSNNKVSSAGVPRTGTTSVSAKLPTRPAPTSVPAKLPTRPIATSLVNKAMAPPRQPLKPTPGGDSKPSAFKKPLVSATKKLESKDDKGSIRQTVPRKLPPSTVPPVAKPPLMTSTPKSDLTTKPKPLSQPKLTRNVAPTKPHLVERSRQHVGLKPPRPVLKANSDKPAKSRKDIGTSKKSNELVIKSKTKEDVNEKPKSETKEESTLEVMATETKIEDACIITTTTTTVTTEHVESICNAAAEYVGISSTTEVRDAILQNETLVEPTTTENTNFAL